MTQKDLQSARNSQVIKQAARSCGFDFCGISKAGFLNREASRLENWLKQKKHATMHWMENYFDMRLNPELLVPGAKVVISLLYNYYPSTPLPAAQRYKISKYAYGDDYHKVIKTKLKQLTYLMQKDLGHFNARSFVDSAPVMEKVWAQKSGLGWIGKHTNLIHKQAGSFFFIAEIIADIDATADAEATDYCGTCTRCIDACPTDALSAYEMDSSRCISYLTIELKDQIPTEFAGSMQDWIYGCDICQDVCPWNRFSKPHHEPRFEPSVTLWEMKNHDWEMLSEELFEQLFMHSAIKRTKYIGLKRNILFAKNKTRNTHHQL